MFDNRDLAIYDENVKQKLLDEYEKTTTALVEKIQIEYPPEGPEGKWRPVYDMALDGAKTLVEKMLLHKYSAERLNIPFKKNILQEAYNQYHDTFFLYIQGENPPAKKLVEIRSAYCDYDHRGRRKAHWFRMVWTGANWEYFGPRLLAADPRYPDTLRQTSRGKVPIGSVLCKHDRGGAVNDVCIVLPDEKPLTSLTFRKEGDYLVITMLDGTERVLPDPRR